MKRASRARLTLHPDAPTVRFDDAFRNREAETEPAPIAAIRLPEAPEDVRDLLGRNARTSIDYRKADFAIGARGAHEHLAARRCELDRVSHEVREQLLNATD